MTPLVLLGNDCHHHHHHHHHHTYFQFFQYHTVGIKYRRCSLTQFSSDHHKHRPTIGSGIHVQEDTDKFLCPAPPGRWYPRSFPHPLLSRPCSGALGALAHPLYIPPAPLNAREFWRGCRERYYGGRRR